MPSNTVSLTNGTGGRRMTTELVRVTPDMATKWLEGNTHNRPIRQSRVNKYAEDMKAGRWRLTHQGLAFSPDGILIDGQHRLWAVIESGCSIEFCISYNVPQEEQLVIDTGIGRDAADSITLEGSLGKVYKHDVAVIRQMVVGLGERKTFSNTEMLEMCAAYMEGARFVNESLEWRVRGVASAAVRAAVARAYWTQDHAMLRRFMEVLASGIPNQSVPAERTVILLRDVLLRAANGTELTQRMRYAKTTRALQAFLHDEIITRNLYEAERDAFNLPGLTKAESRPSLRRKGVPDVQTRAGTPDYKRSRKRIKADLGKVALVQRNAGRGRTRPASPRT